ncbi:MAG: 2-amino-4-hydroxy-6-hydroxymethyldihydropteridine diphosphokinase [Arenicellales bacterium]|jgi:2-amino-4-hydroxy-6-hydroxymethyldihydropteridine diphosphokinase
MQTAYIGFGSNLGDSLSMLETVKKEINASKDFVLKRTSPIYRTQPIDVPDQQDDYINAVFEIETSREPEDILNQLAAIEDRHGRIRGKIRNSARTLDLDLLLVGNHSVQSEILTLPHPRIHQRAFVLFPLYDLSPDLLVPGQGRVEKLLEKVRDQEMQRL